MTSHSISVHLGEQATIKGKFCNCWQTGGVSIGATYSERGFGSSDIVMWGTIAQLQAIVDELGAALDRARAERAERQALEEAKAELAEATS